MKQVPVTCYLNVCLVVVNTTFNIISVISWRSVLLVEETEDPEKTTHLSQVIDKTLSHNILHLALIKIGTHNVSVDMH